MTKLEVGDIFESTSCGRLEVVHYVNCTEVYVQFEESGYVIRSSSGHIRSGLVKDPFYPYLHGLGYFGDLHRESSNIKYYRLWRKMMDRCYLEGYCTSSYGKVTVSKEWLNCSNFIRWCADNYVEGWELDKDVYQVGVVNKVYSKETCIFLPKEINSMLTTRDTPNKYGSRGVKVSGSKFIGRFKRKGVEFSKTFDSMGEAQDYYINNRIDILTELAYKYKSEVNEVTFDNLVNYYKKS